MIFQQLNKCTDKIISFDIESSLVLKLSPIKRLLLILCSNILKSSFII